MTAGSDRDGQPVVVPDPTGTAPGRGAHLHPTQECYDLAVRRKAFTRALFPKGAAPEGGLSSAPVGEYLSQRDQQTATDPVVNGTRNWSSSS